MELPVVGTKVRVKFPVLGNGVGAVGFVYECYEIGKHGGISVIFENGQYDGFSEIDTILCLEILDVDQRFSTYNFKNVNQVWKDYRNGYWKFHE